MFCYSKGIIFKVAKQANEMISKIQKLEDLIVEKEPNMTLVKSRILNRAQRPGIELCKDIVQMHLVHEVQNLRENMTLVQQMLLDVSIYLKSTKLKITFKTVVVSLDSKQQLF